MKITVNKKQIVDVLNSVGRVASTKAVVPITQNVKISIRVDGMMVIMATDTDMSAMKKFKVADSFDAPFEFYIDPRDFGNVLKSLRDDEVTFCVEGNDCIIEHAKGELSLPVFGGDVLPMIEMDKDATKVSFDASRLFKWIRNAAGFVANDELRPIMNGVYLYVNKGEVGVCGTDGHAMFTDYIINDEYNELDVNATLMSKAINPVLDLINGEEKVMVYFSNNKLTFRTSDAILSCTRIEGRYPNFKSIMRHEDSITATVNKEELIDSISRAKLTASTDTSLVTVKVGGDAMRISSSFLEASKTSHETVECEVEGDELLIGVNGARFIGSLKAIGSDNVKLGFKSLDAAINIYDLSWPNKRVTVMPMSMN